MTINNLLQIPQIGKEMNIAIFLADVSDDVSNVSVKDKTGSSKEYINRLLGMILLEKSFIDEYIIDDIYINCDKEDDYFVCYDEITNMQGVGLDENEAKYNYRLVLLDFYEFLIENEKNLLSSDKISLNFLKGIISKM